jgi:hypothetical protein
MSTDVSEVRAASIALMMEAARISETLVNVQLRTLQYIPEDSKLHTHRHENLKSRKQQMIPNSQERRSFRWPKFTYFISHI